MDQRNKIVLYLERLETNLKELQILYEQYFAGVEKREPFQKREGLAKKIRALSSRTIIQTDLRFRSQSIAARFHSYMGYWDRILRLMDEGKYVRKNTAGAVPHRQNSQPQESEIDKLYRDLIAAHREGGNSGTLPDRGKFATLIEQQREKMQQKTGGGAIEFRIVNENGKTKIKVRRRR